MPARVSPPIVGVDPGPDIIAATRQLARRDPALAAIIKVVGPCRIRPGQGDYFAALVRSIAYQQLAGRAAAALHGRLVERVGGVVSAAAGVAAAGGGVPGGGESTAQTGPHKDPAPQGPDGRGPLAGNAADSHDEDGEP